MPMKAKIGVVVMAGIAMFLVYALAQYIHTLADNGPTLNDSQALESPSDDPDHDGLSNSEESLWATDPFNPDSDADGFKDGEEVASGHNPLVPGPDDLINNENLTEQLSALMVAGLAAGDLQPESETYEKSLLDITSSVAVSGTYLFNKTIDPSSLRTITSNAKSNLTYAQTLDPLIKKFDKTLLEQLNKFESTLNSIGNNTFSANSKESFLNQAKEYDLAYKTGLEMTIPKPFVGTHANFISLAQQGSAISQSIAESDIDPVKASMAMSALGDMYEKYINFMVEYSETLDEEEVDIDTLLNTTQ